MKKLLGLSLGLAALISTQTACAWFVKQEAKDMAKSEHAIQGYRVLLVNESNANLKYRFQEFTHQTDNGFSQRELNPHTNTMSLSLTLGWIELETGDQVQLNVLANSELVLEYSLGDTIQKKSLRIQKNQEILLDNHGLRQKDWTPPF